MEVKFNVKRKYIVNGKEYASIEETPADIRQAYERAVSGKDGFTHENISSLSAGKIVFNGQEYESIDSMLILCRSPLLRNRFFPLAYLSLGRQLSCC